MVEAPSDGLVACGHALLLEYASGSPVMTSSSGPVGQLREAPPSVRRAIWRRVLGLSVTVITLYLLWPSMLSLFSAWPDLATIDPGWFVAMLAAEAASFVCMWGLVRVTVRTDNLLAVATSHVAGNAMSRIVPGGAAAGPALQFRMLERAGIPIAKVASGLTAATLVGAATLLFLPVLSIPAALLGGPVPSGLAQATVFGVLVFVALLGAGAVFLAADGPLELTARAFQWVDNRVRRREQPKTGTPERWVRERNDLRRTLGSSWWKAVLYATGNSLFDFLALLATLSAVGSSPRPTLVLLGYVAARILGQVPITPGGIGFVEAGLTGMLVLAGVSATDAVLATLAYRLVSFWLPLPAGLAAFALYRKRYGGRESVEI